MEVQMRLQEIHWRDEIRKPAEELDRKRRIMRTRSDDDWVVTAQKSSVLLQERETERLQVLPQGHDRREKVKEAPAGVLTSRTSLSSLSLFHNKLVVLW
jgi:hypothetical protein